MHDINNQEITRFVGIKNGFIYVISDVEIENDDLIVIKLPHHLNHISSEDLIVNYRYSNGILKAKNETKNISDLKIAFIGNWAQACGISTYFENLLPHLCKDIKNFKLFIEDQNFVKNIYQFGSGFLKKESNYPLLDTWKRIKYLSS